MKLALLVALVGCNQVFHLRDTQAIDAELPVDSPRLFDPPDGSTACPPLPDFSTWMSSPHAVAGISVLFHPSFLSADQVVFTFQDRLYTSDLDGNPLEMTDLEVVQDTGFDEPSALADRGVFWYLRAGGPGTGGMYYAVFDGARWTEAQADIVPGVFSAEPGTPGFYAGTLRMVLSVESRESDLFHLVEMSSDDGITWRMASEPPHLGTDTQYPALSADGCWLAFSDKVAGAYELFASGRGADGAFGMPTQVTQVVGDSAHAFEPAFAPDGKKLWIGFNGSVTEAVP